MDLKKVFFLLFVFFLPIDGTPYLHFQVGIFQVTILDLLLVMMVYIVFLEGAIKGFEVSVFIQRVCMLLVISALLSLVSLMHVPSDHISYDIKMTLNMLEFAALIFIATRIIDSETFLRKVLTVLCFSVFLVSLATILKSVGLDIPGHVRGEARTHIGPFLIGVSGMTRAGMPFSTLVLAALPFVLTGAVIKHGMLRIVFALSFLLASIIAYSRGLWVAVGLMMIVFVSFFYMLDKSLFKRVFISTGLVAALLVLLLRWHDMYVSLVDIRRFTLEQRIDGFFFGLKMVTSSIWYFLFGFGEGAFINVSDWRFGVPHNVLLELFISKGVVITIAICMVFYMIAARIVGTIRLEKVRGNTGEVPALFVVSMVGFLTLGMVTPLFSSISFWTVIAANCAYVSLYQQEAGSISSAGTYENIVYKF